jgi:MFS family permease
MNKERIDGRFIRLWVANSISALGSGVAAVAAPLLIASQTTDPFAVSLATAAVWLPWVLFALPAGALADCVDRRHLMITADVVRAVAVTGLSVAIMVGQASVLLLYATLVLVHTGEVVFRAASQSLIPMIVPRPQLERANGWLELGASLSQGMLSGPVAGALFLAAASLPFSVDAGSYVISAILLALVPGAYRAAPTAATPASRTRPRRAVRADVAEGFRWLMRQRLLRTMAVLIGLLNLTVTAAAAVLVLLVQERLHLGSIGYGALLTCMSAGGVLGAAFGARIIGSLTARWTLRAGLMIEALTHLALATVTNAYLMAAVLFVFGVHGSLWGIVSASLRQRLTPRALLGRVGSTSMFIATGGNFAGALLGGVLGATFGITTVYWLGFVVAILVAAATWRVFTREALGAAYADPESVGAAQGSVEL